MTPDAIIVLSAGTVADVDPQTGKKIYRSTTYAEVDAFGTLGGIARVQAAALLAKKFPQAFLVTTGKDGPDGVSHARTQASELESFGVPRGRIVLEEESVNTRTQIDDSLRIAQKRGWTRILFVTNRYQVERARTFVEHLGERPTCEVSYQDAESVLSESDPVFAHAFSSVEQSESYQRRLASEARGIEAIKSGTYRSAPSIDKRERPL